MKIKMRVEVWRREHEHGGLCARSSFLVPGYGMRTSDNRAASESLRDFLMWQKGIELALGFDLEMELVAGDAPLGLVDELPHFP